MTVVVSRPLPRVLVPVILFVSMAALAAACAPVQPTAETSDVFAGAPWGDGEQLEYTIRNDHGDVVSHAMLSARVEEGRLLLEQRYTEAQPPDGAEPMTDLAVVEVDPATFRPLAGWRELRLRAEDGSLREERYEWEYRDGDDARHLLARRVAGGEVTERELRVRDHHYDNESALWLWRAVDFAEELDRHYVSVNPIEKNQVTVNLRVPQRETIEVPAGEFEAWRIVLRTGRAARTAWINADAPHEILRWDTGDLVFDLEARSAE